MQEDKRTVRMPHNVILEDRHVLTVSGVRDVDSFDEQCIVLFTEQGELTIKGEGLHINKLSVDSGDVAIEGEIKSFAYTDDIANKSSSLFFKLFR